MNNDRHDEPDQTRATLSVREVSRRLGVPEDTVRGWIKRGVLPSLRIGGRRLIRVADLEQLLEGPQEPPDE